jgi:hypothetical protein
MVGQDLDLTTDTIDELYASCIKHMHMLHSFLERSSLRCALDLTYSSDSKPALMVTIDDILRGSLASDDRPEVDR